MGFFLKIKRNFQKIIVKLIRISPILLVILKFSIKMNKYSQNRIKTKITSSNNNRNNQPNNSNIDKTFKSNSSRKNLKK